VTELEQLRHAAGLISKTALALDHSSFVASLSHAENNAANAAETLTLAAAVVWRHVKNLESQENNCRRQILTQDVLSYKPSWDQSSKRYLIDSETLSIDSSEVYEIGPVRLWCFADGWRVEVKETRIDSVAQLSAIIGALTEK